jgi:iron complex outermembrane receptor protein
MALVIDGTNPDLKPETAKSLNLGFTYEPSFTKGLKFEASYFSVDFDNQINRLILQGFFTNVLQQETILGSLVQRNPSLQQVDQELNSPGRTIINYASGNYMPGTYTSSDIQAIAHIGYENTASVQVRGIDFMTSYVGQPTSMGRFRADFGGSYFTSYQQRITPASSEASPVNTVYNPLRFRAKANVGWDKSGWGSNVRLNYSNGYDNTVNPDCSSSNSCSIDAWLTVDPSVSYTIPLNAMSLLSGTRISVDVTNVFNRKPPLVTYPAGYLFRYDPTNANPFLRMFAVTVTKAWGGQR